MGSQYFSGSYCRQVMAPLLSNRHSTGSTLGSKAPRFLERISSPATAVLPKVLFSREWDETTTRTVVLFWARDYF